MEQRNRFLLWLLLLLVVPQVVIANTGDPTWTIQVVGDPAYNNDRSFIHFQWRIADNDGVDEFMPWTEISYRIDGEEAWIRLYKLNVERNGNNNVKETVEFAISGEEHGVAKDIDYFWDKNIRDTYFDWYIPDRVIGKKINIRVETHWREWGANGVTRTNYYDKTITNYPAATVKFNRTSPNEITMDYIGATLGAAINVNGTSYGSVSSSNGSVKIPASVTQSFTGKYSFSRSVSSKKPNPLKYEDTKTITVGDIAPPTNLNYTYKGCDGELTLTWDINPASDQKHTVYIERSQGETMSSPIVIGQVSVAEKKFVDYEAKQGVQYCYRVSHLPDGWKKDSNNGLCAIKKIKIEETPLNLVISKIDANPTKREFTINWEEAQWCPEAQLILIKDNRTLNRKEEISVDKTKRNYVDREVTTCTDYRYSIRMTNLGKIYESNPVSTQLSDKVSFKSLMATKGVYSDRVELKWEVDNPTIVKEYVVSRKELDEPASAFKEMIKKTDNSTMVIWEDRNAVAGKYYNYRVEARVVCLETTTSISIDQIGFVQSTGTVSGRVSFKGGTAVENTCVVLRRVSDGEELATNYALKFNGTDYAEVRWAKSHPFQSTDCSVQFYMNPLEQESAEAILIKNGTDFSASIVNKMLRTTFGNTVLEVPMDTLYNKYTQVTLVRDMNKVSLYINAKLALEQNYVPSTSDNSSILAIGNSKVNATNGFIGCLDELRVWNRALTKDNILKNHEIVLSGTEQGLIGYWQFNEQLNTHFFDLSHTNFDYNGNDGIIQGATSTDVVPTEAQLALKAYTDKSGNYIIRGIPYDLYGTTYTIVPMLGVHQFDPHQHQVHIGGGGLSVINGLDMVDISSFTVTGKVEYRGTRFPVQGATLYVDGQAVVKDGEMVTTGNDGKYTIQVPIGEHFVEVRMTNHGFADNGRYPAKAGVKYDFQNDLAINFTDTTLIKVAGRVAGGRIQEAYPIGFGKSRNNIGNAEVRLFPKKSYKLTTDENSKVESLVSGAVTSKVETYPDYVRVFADTKTGEYVAYLLPEEYNVTYVGTSRYNLPNDQLSPIDLRNVYEEEETISDTLEINMPDGSIVQEIRPDTFRCHLRRSFIYYEEKPTLEITQIGKPDPDVYGEEFYFYEAEKGRMDSIALYQKRAIEGEEDVFVYDYTMHAPIFRQMNPYRFRLKAYEVYLNPDNAMDDRVPVIEGKWLINNELSKVTEDPTSLTNIELEADSTGVQFYSFQGGLPNLAEDKDDPSNSYKSNYSIKFKTTGNKIVDGLALKAYLLGAMPTGNNFTTTGPDLITTILRDPTGSGSTATFEVGTEISNTMTTFESGTLGNSNEVKVKAGLKTAVGFGVITFSESKFDMTTGLSWELNWNKENSRTITTSTTKTYSTSDDGDYVGSDGDLFIGTSTNIIYGAAIDIDLYKSDDTQLEGANGMNYQGFTIGKKKTLRSDISFGTTFVYDQAHIKNNVIPSLELLRNKMFIYDPNPSSYVNTTGRPLYVTSLKPDDENYGKDNDDEVWGLDLDKLSEAERSMLKLNGPSYRIVLPSNMTDYLTVTDSVRFFNKSVKGWTAALLRNEQEKIEAYKKQPDLNYSFSPGVGEITESVTVCEENAYSSSFEYQIMGSFLYEQGFEVAGNGVDISVQADFGGGNGSSEEGAESKCTTYSFTLVDNDPNDALTVDVYKPKGGSPIFRTRAGQTSCPYQGEELTEYYRPGREKIQEATMRVEVPSLSAVKTVVSDVPGGSGAMYELKLANLPETDFMPQSQSLRLKVDDTTNPNGAVLSIDGAILNGEGILFWMPEKGVELKKTLILKQSRTDIMQYENINLILTSDCEDGLEVSLPISAYFKPTSTSFKLGVDNDRSVVNSVTGDTLIVNISDYDRAYENFAGIVLEYKPESASSWITEAYFANTDKEYDRMQGNKYKIDGSTITYKWGLSSLVDRNYMLRARSLSKSSEGAFIAEYIGTSLKVIKDMKSPKELGYPTPADGILKPGMNIAVNFNEQIMKSLVNDYNISVEGELNGHVIRNNVGLDFKGNEKAQTEANLNLTGKSFCIETWLKRIPGTSGAVYSHGTADASMTVGFDAADYLHLYYNGKDLKSRIPVKENGWMHLAVSYNSVSGTITVVIAAQSVAERDKEIIKDAVLGTYSVNGRLRVGDTFDTKLSVSPFTGYMNEFRIWTKDRDMAEITAESTLSLSGLENGLLAYWPMTEAKGVVVKEKVGSKNMLMNCGWYVNPKGYGVTFDGKSQCLKVPAHLFPMTTDNSYTIEFWFKAEQQSKSTMLAYNKMKGNAGETVLENVLSLGVNDSGKLTVKAENKEYQTSNKIFLDNQWHHLALVVNRASKGNVYVDGDLMLSVSSTEFPAIASGYVYVGAYSENQQFYKGSIDELRIWATALNAEQIRLDMSNKLKGDEGGLKAYYPFEAYETDNAGVQNLKPTLTDQLVISSLLEPQKALIVGTDPLSDISASIKEVRQREKVNYTYTVSDNAIVIEVNEQIARIENCTLEFAVNGVEDMNGNQQTSPIKWTAYVNLNTLKWSEKNLYMEKAVLENMSFEISMVNQSGNKENFIIENVPSWLTLSEVSGALEPLETKVLKCTVDPSLNIGRYEEVLYLRGNSDVTSPLFISMKVNGEKPGWSVNPKEYDLAMNMVGALRIEGSLSTDTDDILGAFNGDKCVGVAKPEYIASHDFYALFMTIYGNPGTSKDITFKVWDASTGRTYPTVEPKILYFKEDSVAGSLDEPVQLNALDEIQLTWNMRKGWNWVSVNVDNENLAKPYLLLDPVKESVGYLKGQGTSSMVYDPASPGHHWSGSLVNKGFKPSEAYKAQSTADVSLNIVGKMFKPEDAIVSLSKNWNWIGYIPTTMMSVNEALSNLSAQDGDVIKSQTDFALYYRVNGGWIGSLKYMKPGEGYMYKSVTEKSFTYPSYNTQKVSKASSKVGKIEQNAPNWSCDIYKYSENMNVVAAVCENEQLLENDKYEIGAFVNDECRGVSQLVGNRLFLTVYSSIRGEVIHLRLFDKETSKEFMLSETLSFSGDILGNMDEPYLVDLAKAATSISSEYGLSIYPNPAVDWLYIQGLDDSVDRIKILDISGKIVYLNEGLPVDNRINVGALPDATYVLVIETADRTIHQKFIKGNNK